jgi:RNA polymerase sigma-70 factor, ECF subfamily
LSGQARLCVESGALHPIDRQNQPARAFTVQRRETHLSERLLDDLFDKHGVRLYRYALLILGDEAAAEDAVQETLYSIARIVRRNPEAATAPYAVRSLRNQCFSMLRKRKRSAGTPSRLLEPSAPAASEEERLMLDELLRQLPIEQREVVYWKVFEGMTFQEIAALQDESINTIASRYRYAMSALREALGGHAGAGRD